jgi:hypothetical protein
LAEKPDIERRNHEPSPRKPGRLLDFGARIRDKYRMTGRLELVKDA